jgi:methyl-accepting chemotaxis protein
LIAFIYDLFIHSGDHGEPTRSARPSHATPGRLRLRTKLALLLGLSLASMLALIGASGSLMYQRMTADRVAKLQAVVDGTVSMAQALEAQVTAQQLTREQALEQIRVSIHALRSDGGSGYVYIQSADGTVLVHGTNQPGKAKPRSAAMLRAG